MEVVRKDTEPQAVNGTTLSNSFLKVLLQSHASLNITLFCNDQRVTANVQFHVGLSGQTLNLQSKVLLGLLSVEFCVIHVRVVQSGDKVQTRLLHREGKRNTFVICP